MATDRHPLLRGNKNLLLLLLGGTASTIGSQALSVVIPIWVYELTGSVSSTAIAVASVIAPQLLLGPFAGAFADRFDRRRIMISCDLARAVIVLGLLTVGPVGAVWPIYVVGFAESTALGVFAPARAAFIPMIVPRSGLLRANAINATCDSVAMFVGPGVGAGLFAVFGPNVVVAADVLSYVVSAVAVGAIAVPVVSRGFARISRETQSQLHLRSQIASGAKLLASQPVPVAARRACRLDARSGRSAGDAGGARHSVLARQARGPGIVGERPGCGSANWRSCRGLARAASFAADADSRWGRRRGRTDARHRQSTPPAVGARTLSAVGDVHRRYYDGSRDPGAALNRQ